MQLHSTLMPSSGEEAKSLGRSLNWIFYPSRDSPSAKTTFAPTATPYSSHNSASPPNVPEFPLAIVGIAVLMAITAAILFQTKNRKK